MTQSYNLVNFIHLRSLLFQKKHEFTVRKISCAQNRIVASLQMDGPDRGIPGAIAVELVKEFKRTEGKLLPFQVFSFQSKIFNAKT